MTTTTTTTTIDDNRENEKRKSIICITVSLFNQHESEKKMKIGKNSINLIFVFGLILHRYKPGVGVCILNYLMTNLGV